DASGSETETDASGSETETDASGSETETDAGSSETETETETDATEPTEKEGLILDADGVFRYYQNSEFAESYVGVVPYDGGLFFIKNGLIDFGANELCLYENVWYYVSFGQVQLQYTGLAIHDGAWFYITNGLLDTTVNGLVSYNGETFVIAVGRICMEYSGLWLNAVSIGGNNQWYYIGAGMVQKVSQVVMYDGALFIVKEGILDTGNNGTITYGGINYIVVNGQLYVA
ncbi:MAG: hypothetical protein LUF27_08405, partial [Lachnospiraceae bacterium]|nr:hypothetical protein [Lachnospiraceae bacterium]